MPLRSYFSTKSMPWEERGKKDRMNRIESKNIVIQSKNLTFGSNGWSNFKCKLGK